MLTLAASASLEAGLLQPSDRIFSQRSPGRKHPVKLPATPKALGPGRKKFSGRNCQRHKALREVEARRDRLSLRFLFVFRRQAHLKRNGFACNRPIRCSLVRAEQHRKGRRAGPIFDLNSQGVVQDAQRH